MRKNCIWIRNRFQIRLATLLITIILLLILVISCIPNQNKQVTATKADYYNITFNSTLVTQETNGKAPVTYVITVINSGNKEDTFTLFTNIIEVTNCDEPDLNDWSYVIDKTRVTLQPSHSTSVILTVSSSCDCQIGCKATIAVKGISSGDPSVTNQILTYTTRGQTEQNDGLIVEIDFDQFINKIYIDKPMEFDVNVWNFQHFEETVQIWPTDVPENWTVSLSQNEINIGPKSKRTIKLTFTIPKGVVSGEYIIELRVQSLSSPGTTSIDNIKIDIKPDIIIKDVILPKKGIAASDKANIQITLENIGLITANNIPIIIYDQLDYTTEHELKSDIITLIESNQTYQYSFIWQPKHKGNYNLTIWLNPESTLTELRDDNNLRIEPITVVAGRDKKADSSDDYYIIIYLSAGILIIICIIVAILVLYKNAKKQKKEEPDQNQESKLDSKYKPTQKHRLRDLQSFKKNKSGMTRGKNME